MPEYIMKRVYLFATDLFLNSSDLLDPDDQGRPVTFVIDDPDDIALDVKINGFAPLTSVAGQGQMKQLQNQASVIIKLFTILKKVACLPPRK